MSKCQSAREHISRFVRIVQTWNPSIQGGDGLINYIDLSSVDQEQKVIVAKAPIPSKDAPSRARQIVRDGDVLVSTVRPNLNGVAMVPSELDGATASTGFCVLRADEEGLSSRYLYHWVRGAEFVSNMTRLATGASYPAVTDQIVLDSQIPLPPLPEQRRIAAILDQADALRTKRRQALARLDGLRQALFFENFGCLSQSSQEWPVSRLLDACVGIFDCPHSTPAWADYGEICLRTPNLTRGSWDWTDIRFVSQEDYRVRSRRQKLEAGDIVLSREGTVGVAAIVPPSLKACMGQRLVQVRPNPDVLVPEFLLAVLLYRLDPSRLSASMVGSTSQHLNVRDLKKMSVPLPPLRLQKKFAAESSTVDKIETAYRASLARLDSLFASLQYRAFRGEL